MMAVARPAAAAGLTATAFDANSASDVASLTPRSCRVGVTALDTDTGVFGSSVDGNGVFGSTRPDPDPGS
jgi:hypothetical protein